jgi:hypothetical protein
MAHLQALVHQMESTAFVALEDAKLVVVLLLGNTIKLHHLHAIQLLLLLNAHLDRGCTGDLSKKKIFSNPFFLIANL